MLTITKIASSFDAATGPAVVVSLTTISPPTHIEHRENLMAAGEAQTRPGALEAKTSEPRSWHGVVLQMLKRNGIRLAPYVPDRVQTPLISNLHADPLGVRQAL